MEKQKEAERRGGNTLQIFPVPVFCRLSLGNQVFLIKELKFNDGMSSAFID